MSSLSTHAWAQNASKCAESRYFEIREDAAKTGEDLDNAYATWVALEGLAMDCFCISDHLGLPSGSLWNDFDRSLPPLA